MGTGACSDIEGSGAGVDDDDDDGVEVSMKGMMSVMMLPDQYDDALWRDWTICRLAIRYGLAMTTCSNIIIPF